MRALALVLVLVLVVGACAGPSPTPAPVQSEAPATGGPGSGAPPTPVAGGQGEVAAIIVALNLDFAPKAVTVAAGEPFVLVMDNQDAGIPHNLEIKGPDGATIVMSEVVTGPVQQPVPVPALAAGTYPFLCTIHPNMTGAITVE
jgi:plastocyanin